MSGEQARRLNEDGMPVWRTTWVSLVIGVALAIVGAVVLREPMAVAFWGLACGALLLPLVSERDADFLAAMSPVVFVVALMSGVGSALVVAVVSGSLWGSVRMLVWLRVHAHVAVAAIIVQAILLLTWPLWAARLLLAFDSEPVVDLLVRFGPLFAINRAIDPTDAFTHRPGAYRWMNLGQDIPYVLPATIWPCVMLHGGIGAAGLVSRRWTQMNADKKRRD